MPGGSTSVVGSEGALDVLGSLGLAVAIGVEAGEEVDEVSTGTVSLRVCMCLVSRVLQFGPGCPRTPMIALGSARTTRLER